MFPELPLGAFFLLLRRLLPAMLRLPANAFFCKGKHVLLLQWQQQAWFPREGACPLQKRFAVRLVLCNGNNKFPLMILKAPFDLVALTACMLVFFEMLTKKKMKSPLIKNFVIYARVPCTANPARVPLSAVFFSHHCKGLCFAQVVLRRLRRKSKTT